MPPDKIRVNGCTVYRIIINGILFSFFASSQADQLKLGSYSINEKGEMKLIVEEARQIPYVSQILLALGKAIHQRKDS